MLSPESEKHDIHPANLFHQKLYSVDSETSDSITWESHIESLVEDIRDLSDLRSVASVMFSITYTLRERGRQHHSESLDINELIDSKIIPLWERELSKKDNWVQIADDIFEFASTVGGQKAKYWIGLGAQMLRSKLPGYPDIPSLFPDEGIENGIDAARKGRRGWYQAVARLYKFCDIGNDAAKILELCHAHDWPEEALAWQSIKTYFDELLINIDLHGVDPLLIEGMQKYVTKAGIPSQLRLSIRAHTNKWKRKQRIANDKRTEG